MLLGRGGRLPQDRGVVDTAVGYMGGTTEVPTYKMVCTGRTGHAETTEVDYDPSIVSYGQLLEAFWSMHDPTQVNRQGVDVGSQYRSVIFYFDEEQRAEAERSKKEAEVSGRFHRPIATQIVPATKFWRAEEYHQRYFEKNKNAQCTSELDLEAFLADLHLVLRVGRVEGGGPALGAAAVLSDQRDALLLERLPGHIGVALPDVQAVRCYE